MDDPPGLASAQSDRCFDPASGISVWYDGLWAEAIHHEKAEEDGMPMYAWIAYASCCETSRCSARPGVAAFTLVQTRTWTGSRLRS